MDEQFEVSSGGKVAGPVSLDQVRRGVAAGVIPKDAQVRRLGAVLWQPVLDVLQLHPPPPLPAPEIATGAVEASRYKNLHAVSGMLRSYGEALKLIAWLLGGLGLLGALFADGALAKIMALTAGLLVGLSLHVTGTFIAAMGEGLLALADIALNTTPRAGS
jgi:hypothetical protein